MCQNLEAFCYTVLLESQRHKHFFNILPNIGNTLIFFFTVFDDATLDSLAQIKLYFVSNVKIDDAAFIIQFYSNIIFFLN